VDTQAPDVRVNVYVHEDVAKLSIDLSGDSLHRRGWRRQGVEAPLKETLAAAILLLAEWPAAAEAGTALVDPMCGSGTLPIEAALMAADVAPGLHRRRFGFSGWRGHDAPLWQRLVDEARARQRPVLPRIYGSDEDGRAIRAATDNARRAGVNIEFRQARFADAAPPEGAGAGILVMNPPYGERLGEAAALAPLYEQIGAVLRHRFTGWRTFVLAADPALVKRIGLRAARKHVLFNGAIECRLLELPIDAEAPRAPMRPRATVRAEPFANRVRKNLEQRRKWAEREDVHCYRVYDADLVEYAVAIDLYENAAHVQEYAPPATVDAERAEERLGDVLALVPELLDVAAADVFLKQRRRQRGGTQYERQAKKGRTLTVREGGHRFLVNLSDYLDTGLFLDHRRLRAMIQSLSAGKRVLNLFAYTGSATIYAAAGGARSSTSVDLSNTYLDWAAENFALNRVSQQQHRLVRADVAEFLEDERGQYDLIFLAPPTFSKSKGMTHDFDLQRDHASLIRASAARLATDGVLLFSNHFRKFKLDRTALPGLRCDDISKKTLPVDFARDPRFHNSWRITRER
jgi:23S rRNA (guanine2445-N2)-methyltransferase / 23S rRNA (guanine2069-N7)-methyltransferase